MSLHTQAGETYWSLAPEGYYSECVFDNWALHEPDPPHEKRYHYARRTGNYYFPLPIVATLPDGNHVVIAFPKTFMYSGFGTAKQTAVD